VNARPRRGDLWTCPVCGARNEPSAVSCMNACREDTPQGRKKVRGPLATPRDENAPRERKR